jgi:hypothetical protein
MSTRRREAGLLSSHRTSPKSMMGIQTPEILIMPIEPTYSRTCGSIRWPFFTYKFAKVWLHLAPRAPEHVFHEIDFGHVGCQCCQICTRHGSADVWHRPILLDHHSTKPLYLCAVNLHEGELLVNTGRHVPEPRRGDGSLLRVNMPCVELQDLFHVFLNGGTRNVMSRIDGCRPLQGLRPVMVARTYTCNTNIFGSGA